MTYQYVRMRRSLVGKRIEIFDEPEVVGHCEREPSDRVAIIIDIEQTWRRTRYIVEAVEQHVTLVLKRRQFRIPNSAEQEAYDFLRRRQPAVDMDTSPD